jgi:hypothetical protein
MIETYTSSQLKEHEKTKDTGLVRRTLDKLPWSEVSRLNRLRKQRPTQGWTDNHKKLGNWIPSCPDYYRPTKEMLGGGVQGWTEPLHVLTADGTQISNSTSETIVCPDFNIPAYYLSAGRTFRLWAWGVMSNVITTPGTLTMRVRWGGVAGTTLLASAAQGLDTTARTNSLWLLQAMLVCRSDGSTGTMCSGGIFFGNVLSTTAANLLPALLGQAGNPLAGGTAAANSVAIDTTTAKLLSITGQFSVSTSPTNLNLSATSN